MLQHVKQTEIRSRFIGIVELLFHRERRYRNRAFRVPEIVNSLTGPLILIEQVNAGMGSDLCHYIQFIIEHAGAGDVTVPVQP